ncbi:hypothetical protein SmJEL517_g04619 [Synchytrium microbalum]|uniref:Fork-head domain-containing protein n=1 Tax=Synchytrium microbalum TaxID=1806994 RepID=A0A507BR30_9FUNG|nr:uncharacterized protein SmJEL517_g04619 [Synchytrium microbalum]TPX32190.1 hypothetical protein SmJEL517_g04619 [Synchytrium microbalum]
MLGKTHLSATSLTTHSAPRSPPEQHATHIHHADTTYLTHSIPFTTLEYHHMHSTSLEEHNDDDDLPSMSWNFTHPPCGIPDILITSSAAPSPTSSPPRMLTRLQSRMHSRNPSRAPSPVRAAASPAKKSGVIKEPVECMYETMKAWHISQSFGDAATDGGEEEEHGRRYPRPRTSYSELIREAIEASVTKSLSLQEIYDAIRERHPYFRETDSAWKNSIRHNLSVHSVFVKKPRPLNRPGKGFLWTVNKAKVKHGGRRNGNNGSLQRDSRTATSSRTATPSDMSVDPATLQYPSPPVTSESFVDFVFEDSVGGGGSVVCDNVATEGVIQDQERDEQVQQQQILSHSDLELLRVLLETHAAMSGNTYVKVEPECATQEPDTNAMRIDQQDSTILGGMSMAAPCPPPQQEPAYTLKASTPSDTDEWMCKAGSVGFHDITLPAMSKLASNGSISTMSFQEWVATLGDEFDLVSSVKYQ